jgi:hypothetical protein
MRNHSVLLAFLALFFTSCNQVSTIDKLFFVGEIDGVQAEILLFNQKDTLRGVSIHNGAAYELQAYLDGSTVIIHEFDSEGSKTGSFEGKMNENYFEGTWSRANGQQKKTFKLQRKQWESQRKFIVMSKRYVENAQHYSMQITYPYFVNVFNLEEITFLNQKIDIFISSAIENFKESLNEMTKEDWAEFSADSQATLEISYVTARLDEQLVSINFGVLEYSVGAAHPIHYYHAINYDFVQKQEILFDDLFQQTQLAELTKYINNTMANSEDIPCEIGNEPEILQNFLLKTDTIYFYFDDYVLGAYACGNPVTAIPKNIFMPLIQPEFAHLFQEENINP